MPLFLVSKLKQVKYGSEKFINWYIKFPNIQETYKGANNLKARRDLFYIISSYYVWIFYLISAVIISTENLLIGAISAFISPFIIAGYMYAAAYTEQEYRKIKHRKRS